MKTPSNGLVKGQAPSLPKVTCGLSLGLTLQPQPYESIRVDVSYSIEGLEGQEAELWQRVEKEVEQQLERQLRNMITGYAALKNINAPVLGVED